MISYFGFQLIYVSKPTFALRIRATVVKELNFLSSCIFFCLFRNSCSIFNLNSDLVVILIARKPSCSGGSKKVEFFWSKGQRSNLLFELQGLNGMRSNFIAFVVCRDRQLLIAIKLALKKLENNYLIFGNYYNQLILIAGTENQ